MIAGSNSLVCKEIIGENLRFVYAWCTFNETYETNEGACLVIIYPTDNVLQNEKYSLKSE